MSKPLTVDDLRDRLKKIQAACDHEKFKASVSVDNPRDNPDEPSGYRATITIKCGLCGLPFEFVGVSSEPSKERPMVARSDRELRVPLRPQGEEKKATIQ